MKTLKFYSLIHLFTVLISAGIHGNEGYYSGLKKTSEAIVINGIADEEVWQNTTPLSGFWQHFPNDTIRALAETEVYLTYDDTYLYVLARCYEENNRPVIQSLKRDDIDKFWTSDAFSLVIDPMNKDKNGYFFGLTAGGVQVDGTVAQIGVQPALNSFWNNMWLGETHISENVTVYEIAIPFSSLKYSGNIENWGINFIRNDMKRSVFDVWTRFPLNYDGMDLGYNGTIVFGEGISKAERASFELLPAVSGTFVRGNDPGARDDYSLQGGLDAKLSLGSNLNLDLSVYPDFSNVEVDQQFIDFYRYESYAPEQRIFFLENNDLFSNFGSYEDYLTAPYAYKVKPLYTRRIAIKDWNYFRMLYGARFSGNINEDLRIGLLNVQTGKYENLPSQNFTAAVFQQSVLKRSSVKGLFTNRENSGVSETETYNFNRTAGIEFDNLSDDGKWSVLGKYHQSFNPVNLRHSNYYGGGVAYNSQKFQAQGWMNHVGDNYIADAGYVPRLYIHDALKDTVFRLGYTEITSHLMYSLPQTPALSYHGALAHYSMYLQPYETINEVLQETGYFARFADGTTVYIGYLYNHTRLLYAFDVLRNDKPLEAGMYDFLSVIADAGTNPVRKMHVKFFAEYGGFYSGTKLYTDMRIGYRVQPWGTFLVSYTRCDLKFPAEYGNAIHHLVGLRSEIGFTRDLLWTTFMQYNTQKENISLNSQVQWRFRPMSDFFLIVRQNTDIEGYSTKDLNVIFKVNFWLKV
jgi:hypothetical protein